MIASAALRTAPVLAASPAAQAPARVDDHALQVQSTRNLIDKLKQKSTLVGLIEPIGIATGLVSHPLQTLDSVGQIASTLAHGNVSDAVGGLSKLVDGAYHPSGFAGAIRQGGLYVGLATDGVIGGLELVQGLRNRDHYLAGMGAADLLSGACSGALAFGAAGSVAVGLGALSAATKVVMVVAKPEEYSRIQKAKAFFGAAGTMSSTLLRAGIAPVPALIGNAIFGPLEMLYMNNDKVRAKVDHAVDWVLDKVIHHDPAPAPPAPSTPQAPPQEPQTP